MTEIKKCKWEVDVESLLVSGVRFDWTDGNRTILDDDAYRTHRDALLAIVFLFLKYKASADGDCIIKCDEPPGATVYNLLSNVQSLQENHWLSRLVDHQTLAMLFRRFRSGGSRYIEINSSLLASDDVHIDTQRGTADALLKGIRSRVAKPRVKVERLYLKCERQVSGRDLFRLLKAQRTLRRESLDTIALRMRQLGGPTWILPSERALRSAEKLSSVRDVAISEAEPLALAYGVGGPTLLSLASEPTTTHQLVFRDSDCSDPVDGDRKDPKASRTYRIPKNRLADVDVQIALLEIGEEDDSPGEPHDHTGDEIIIGIEGVLELQLRHSGVSVPIQRGELVHFNARHLHSVRRLPTEKKKAKAIIIRILQLEGGAWSRVEKELASTQKSKALVSQLVSSVSRVAVESFDELHDPAGLSQALQGFLRLRDKSATDLINETRTLTQNTIRHLLAGKKGSSLPAADLASLARSLEVPPIFFSVFLAPAVVDCIVLRGLYDAPFGKADWFDSDLPALSDSAAEGIEYEVPKRHLVGTDVAINLLHMKENSPAPVSGHPGHELAILLKGSVELKVKEDEDQNWEDVQPIPMETSPTNPCFAFFDSTKEHSIWAKEDSTLILFRIMRS